MCRASAAGKGSGQFPGQEEAGQEALLCREPGTLEPGTLEPGW